MPDSLPSMSETLLVVYAVLWAGTLATFGRLRAFAINEIVVPGKRLMAWMRLCVGVLLGNIGPVALLVGLLLWLPNPAGAWGVAVGGLAGLSVTVFPRLVHVFLGSDQFGPRFHDPEDFDAVLRNWDKTWFKRRATLTDKRNHAATHLLVALIILALSLGSAILIGLIADEAPVTDPSTIHGSWIFESIAIDGEPVELDAHIWERNPIEVLGAPLWIRYDDDGWLQGAGPCNDFHGFYEFDGRTFTPDDIAQSAVSCGDSIDDAERLLFTITGEGTVEFFGDRSEYMEWSDGHTQITLQRTRRELSLP